MYSRVFLILTLVIIQVSLQMLKVVDLVKGEEIAATTFYHRLTKENSELLRRYCFYLNSVIILFHKLSIIVTSCHFYVLAPYVKKHHNQKEYWRIGRNIYREKVLLCIFQTSSIPLKLTLERLPRYIALAEASLSSI